MADEVDSLTDSQLRTRLSEFGLPVVPITATTRKLMTKKLKMLIESGNKAAKSNRLSLAKYSSGEESDQDNKKKVDKSRRYTTGGAMLPPSKVPMKATPRPKTPIEELPQKSDNELPTKESPGKIIQKSITKTTKSFTKTIEVRDSSEEEREPVTTSRRTTRMFKHNHPSPATRTETLEDSVSDSDEELPEPVKPTLTRTTPSPPSLIKKTAPSFSQLTSSFSQPAPSFLQQERKLFDTDSTLSSRYVSTTTNTPGRLDQNFGRTLPSVTTVRGSSISDSTKTDGYDSPFLSEFTRRLEQNKRKTVGVPSSLYDNRTTAFSSSNRYAELPSRNYDTYSRITQRSSITPTTQTKKQSIFSSLTRKHLLQGFGLIVLLASLVFAGERYYQYSKENVFQIDADHKIPICRNKDAVVGSESYIPPEPQEPGKNCVLENNVKQALMLCKLLLPELNSRAVTHQCGDASVDPFMDGKDVLNFVRKQTPAIKSEQLFADFDNLQLMVLNNPNWGLIIVDKTYNTEVTSLEELSKSETYQNLALKVISPALPLSCILSNKFYSILYTVAICLVGFGIVYGIQSIIKYLVNKREENERQVYSMVEKITEILRKEGGETECIAINHIRDRLISPHERQSRNHIWEKAVKFLEENDSRVRSEVQSVAGEDFRVWRWLDSSAQSSKF